MRAFLDSDVLIWHLRGAPQALRLIRKFRGDPSLELWTGAMQRAEVVFFTRPEEDEATLLFLAHIRTAPVDAGIVDRAGQLYRRWNPSHGIDVHDALLAATVLETGGVIYGLNQKHYPMPEVVFRKAW